MLFSAQRHLLVLLPSHWQYNYFLKGGQLWSCFLGFHPDNGLKKDDAVSQALGIGVYTFDNDYWSHFLDLETRLSGCFHPLIKIGTIRVGPCAPLSAFRVFLAPLRDTENLHKNLYTPRPDYTSQRPLLTHTHKNKALASDTTKP